MLQRPDAFRRIAFWLAWCRERLTEIREVSSWLLPGSEFSMCRNLLQVTIYNNTYVYVYVNISTKLNVYIYVYMYIYIYVYMSHEKRWFNGNDNHPPWEDLLTSKTG